MKSTHRLYRWHKHQKDREFQKVLISESAGIKKNGNVMYYNPGYGSSYVSYFHSRAEARTVRFIRISEWHPSGEKISKCEVYYTLEKK